MVVALEPVVVLSLLLACAVLISLSFAYRATFGVLLGELAKLGAVKIRIPHVYTLHPLAALADAADAIDKAIQHALGTAIGNTEWALNRALQWFAYSVQWIGRAIGDLADDVDRAFAHLLAHTVPHVAKVVTTTIVRPVEHTVTRTRVVTHALAAGAMAHVTTLEKRLAHLTRAVALATAGAIANPWPRIRMTEREAAASRKWIAKHAGLLTAAGISALVVAALGRLGLGWTRCDKLRRYGPRFCHVDASVLESLLAGAALIVSAVSIVEFAKVMLAAEDEIVRGLRRGFRELHGIEPLKFEGYTGTLG